MNFNVAIWTNAAAAATAAAIVSRYDGLATIRIGQNRVVTNLETSDIDFAKIRTIGTTSNTMGKDRNWTGTKAAVHTVRLTTLTMVDDDSNRLESTEKSVDYESYTNPGNASMLNLKLYDDRKNFHRDEIDFPDNCVLYSDTIDRDRRRCRRYSNNRRFDWTKSLDNHDETN